MMNPIVKDAWNGEPPKLYIIAKPLPNAPHVWIAGGGTANMSVEKYLQKLQTDFDSQTGKYFAYVMGGCKEEADTFTLQTWDVYTSSTSCYEALIILYYAPINEYLCLKKHMGEKWAQKYLDEVNARDIAIAAISDVLEQSPT